MQTDNSEIPRRYSGKTSTFMEDEGIALVHIEVDGSVGYVVDAIVVHSPVVVSNREVVEWLGLAAQEAVLLRHWKGIKRARATIRRDYPPKHGLDKVVQHGLLLQLFFPRLGTYHSAHTLHRYSECQDSRLTSALQ